MEITGLSLISPHLMMFGMFLFGVGVTVLKDTIGQDNETAKRLVIEIEDVIQKYGPNIMPLTWISRESAKKAVKNQEFNVLEDEPLPRLDRVNYGSGYNTTDTGIVVDNGTYFRKMDVVKNTRTKEEYLVTSISTNTLTVVRAYGTTAGTAILDNDELRIVGNALDESHAAVDARATQVASRTNYCQFFSRTVDLTEIRSNTEDYGQDEEDRLIENGRYEFLVDIESAFLFGEPLKEIEGSSPLDAAVDHSRYKTGGAFYWIDSAASSNVLDAGGILTQKEFWDWADLMFKNSPVDTTDGEKTLLLFHGTKGMSILNQWAMTPIQTTPEITRFGMKLKEYQTPSGRFLLRNHYLLEGDEYDDYMLALNPEFIGYRFLNNMDMKFKPNIQDPDSHLVKHEFYGVIGFYLTLPKVHGYIKNASLPG